MKRYSEVLRELRKRMSEPSRPSPDVLARLKAIRERLAQPKKEPA
jgi:hypothetical protein